MDTKGFMASLFDFSFSSYITSKIIRILYILSVIVAALFYLAYVVVSFQISAAMGIFVFLIIGPFLFLLTVTYARVLLEIIMVLFRIADDVRTLARDKEAG